MDEDAVSDEKVNDKDPDVEEDNTSLQEAVSPDGERLRVLGSVGEVLARVELDLAYSSEKLLNLEILLMHVVTRQNDYEILSMENEQMSDDSVEKGFEFDLLSGILDSEVREMKTLIASLQPEILHVRENISSYEQSREAFSVMERKLRDSEESLEQSLNQVAEIRMQCNEFQRTLLAFCGQDNWNNSRGAGTSEIGHYSDKNAKIKMQTTEQQRHILRMLEKSLARELDLEKKLSDSRNSEEELNLKIHSAEQEMFCMDEALEDVWSRFFGAENTAEVLMGISKEIVGRLQIVQFNLNGSIQREGEVRSKLQELVKPAETKGTDLRMLETHSVISDVSIEENKDIYTHASSEVLTLREKVHSLELQLKEREIQVQTAKDYTEENEEKNISTSELSEMKNMIEDLKINALRAENRAETAEVKCSLLEETNSVLSEELGLFKRSDHGIEKVDLLEKQLRESDIQLEQAKASAEANQEQQNMLYSAITDMENLINDLKSKVSRAESRADEFETKCIFLSETNSELDEEVSILRSKMEGLETSLHQVEEEKTATAKEINRRTKVIADMVMQLSHERKRLHKQMSLLTKENKLLAAKFSKDCGGNNCDKELFGKVDLTSGIATKESEESVTESSPVSVQVNKSERYTPVGETEVESTASAVDAAVGQSSNDTVRNIEARQLNSKYFLIPIVILLLSAIAVHLFQPESCRL